MISTEKLYCLDDISVIPAVSSNIKSRKECNPFTESIEGTPGFLPVIAAPMDSVVDNTCYEEFWRSGISCIIPRTVPLETRLGLCGKVFCAFGFKEIEDEFLGKNCEHENLYILIDVANGHMTYQFELGERLREKYETRLKLMGGNIANPDTYKHYEDSGFDYVRCGIGGGCFIRGTKVLMSDGREVSIENIKPGDSIINSKGDIDTVIDTTKLISDKELLKINESITCTENHQFYVINKSDIDCISDDNIHEFAHWIQAKDLDTEKHMLIELNV